MMWSRTYPVKIYNNVRFHIRQILENDNIIYGVPFPYLDGTFCVDSSIYVLDCDCDWSCAVICMYVTWKIYVLSSFINWQTT